MSSKALTARAGIAIGVVLMALSTACGGGTTDELEPVSVELAAPVPVNDVTSTADACDKIAGEARANTYYFDQYRLGAVSNQELAKLVSWLADLARRLSSRVEGESADLLASISSDYLNLAGALRNGSQGLIQVALNRVDGVTRKFNDLCDLANEAESSSDSVISECEGSDTLADSAMPSDRYWYGWCSSEAHQQFVAAGLLVEASDSWRSVAETIAVNMCEEMINAIASGSDVYDARLQVENRLRDGLLNGSRDQERMFAAARAALTSANLAIEHVCPDVAAAANAEAAAEEEKWLQLEKDRALISALASDSAEAFDEDDEEAQAFRSWWDWQLKNMFPPLRTFYGDTVLLRCLEAQLEGNVEFRFDYFEIDPDSTKETPAWQFSAGVPPNVRSFQPGNVGRVYEARFTNYSMRSAFEPESSVAHVVVIDGRAYFFPIFDHCLS